MCRRISTTINSNSSVRRCLPAYQRRISAHKRAANVADGIKIVTSISSAAAAYGAHNAGNNHASYSIITTRRRVACRKRIAARVAIIAHQHIQCVSDAVNAHQRRGASISGVMASSAFSCWRVSKNKHPRSNNAPSSLKSMTNVGGNQMKK